MSNSLADGRRHAPATQRNREPILAVLNRVLPATAPVLEIASGTGEHAVFFAPALAPRPWIPSDPDPQARQSIAAWRQAQPAPNLAPPLPLDVTQPHWWGQVPPLDAASLGAIVAINLIHIAPWSACLGLLEGASQLLPPGGILYLYGPYRLNGDHTAPSNQAFDQQLRAENPDWGVRDREAVVMAARHQGLELVETVAMPANNLSLVFKGSRARLS
ncbi:MAG: DUF938 domain-containing protein [Cyanobacteriota bacterium]|jgi:hypothetical protein|nr:DUF938 domain-containing protein [Cyanobacteriota bacterium]